MGCFICEKAIEEASADLCPAHARALGGVKRAYEAWEKAYGSLLQDDFLKRVAKLQGLGKEAREIVGFLQKRPEKWN